jgi:hypothetical protein
MDARDQNPDELDDEFEEFDEPDTPDERDFEDEDGEGSTLALFEGDDGGLSPDQRRTLVALLKHRFISAEHNPAEWRVLRADPRPIKARLNDMFLDLHLDTTFDVAYKRQAVSEGSGREFPTLLHDIAYNREETILLVFLRRRYHSERATGHSDVTIEEAELLSHVATFRPPQATDREGDRQRAVKAVESLVRARILTRTNDQARLRISPAVPALLPLTRLRELKEWLVAENGGASTPEPGYDPVSALTGTLQTDVDGSEDEA